jgi:structural maintenance of chromosome 1
MFPRTRDQDQGLTCRLKDVQSGLTEAEEEADETRKESRRARDEFLELKKKRCDLFYKAYNHMSGCIDKVYKELTRDKHHVQGGVAFLSLEDAEVSSPVPVLGQS